MSVYYLNAVNPYLNSKSTYISMTTKPFQFQEAEGVVGFLCL